MYTHDPYVPPRSTQQDDELKKVRDELNLLKKNASLKARMRGDHQLFGGPKGGYGGREGGYQGKGGRGTGYNNNGGSGRFYSAMTLTEKQNATCAAWNRAGTPGGAGGCTNPETNGHCMQNGVRLRHACSAVKPGGTHICWDRRHTAAGHSN